MNQLDAIIQLSVILDCNSSEVLERFKECTGMPETCPIEECMVCGVRDCPGNEPLHYHHDGCPYCSEEGA